MIVNADDLGVNEECNNLIFDLMAKRNITSATILANCPGTQDALRRVRQFPHCSFGAHLNATAFRPLTSDPSLSPLLDADGKFSRKWVPSRLGQSTRRALFKEFCMQMERLIGAGVSISHIDSHHHVHNLPWVFPVLKAVQRRYRIRKVRISQNLYPPSHAVSTYVRLKKRAFNWALRNIYQTRTTEGFTDLRTLCDLLKSERLRLSTVEAMVHPGPATYQTETDFLQSGWAEELPSRIEKINYDQL